MQLVLPRHLRPRRDKIFGPAPSHRLDGNAKARLWAAAAAYNSANRVPRQHQGPLTWATLRVLRALLWRFHSADGGGRCFPSYERIAAAAKCARSTVALAVRELEGAGLLTWVHRLTKIRRRARSSVRSAIIGYRAGGDRRTAGCRDRHGHRLGSLEPRCRHEDRQRLKPETGSLTAAGATVSSPHAASPAARARRPRARGASDTLDSRNGARCCNLRRAGNSARYKRAPAPSTSRTSPAWQRPPAGAAAAAVPALLAASTFSTSASRSLRTYLCLNPAAGALDRALVLAPQSDPTAGFSCPL